MPKKDHIYTCTVDVSRNTNNDYSAFLIFDTTQMPYKLVENIEVMKLNQLYFLIL